MSTTVSPAYTSYEGVLGQSAQDVRLNGRPGHTYGVGKTRAILVILHEQDKVLSPREGQEGKENTRRYVRHQTILYVYTCIHGRI